MYIINLAYFYLYWYLQVSTMIVAICQLYHAVQDLINKHEQEKIKVMSPKILDEWRNALVSDAQSGIVRCWMLYAGIFMI